MSRRTTRSRQRPIQANSSREHIRPALIAADARSNASLNATKKDARNQHVLGANGSFGSALLMPIDERRRRRRATHMVHRELFRSWQVLICPLQTNFNTCVEVYVTQDLTLVLTYRSTYSSREASQRNAAARIKNQVTLHTRNHKFLSSTRQ
jgi:hypothetical protein